MFNPAIQQVNAADDSPSLVNSSWLWADDGLTLLVPANETIALRRTIVAPQGKGLKSADIIMTADNAFSLYVDGILIGSTPQGSNPNGWQSGQRFVVGLAGNSSLFAVSAPALALALLSQESSVVPEVPRAEANPCFADLEPPRDYPRMTPCGPFRDLSASPHLSQATRSL